MDCLDRTNVVQSALARWVLNRQLRRIGILGELEKIENDNAAMSVFNNGKSSFIFVVDASLQP